MKLTWLIPILFFVCLFFLPGSVLALNAVERVGNPGLSQYPLNDNFDCYARAIRELQYYQGKIYIGHGHWGYYYSGRYRPAQVWSIDSGDNFKKEVTTRDEVSYPIFVEEGKLFVSPGDTLHEDRTGSYSYIYMLENGVWQRAVVSGSNKGVLRGFCQGALYFNVSQGPGGTLPANLLKYSDLGQTWQIILENYLNQGLSLGNGICLGDYFLLMGADQTSRQGLIFKWYPDGSYDRYNLTYPIGVINEYANRLVRFQGGVLYIANLDAGYNLFDNPFQFELLFLDEFFEGAAAEPVGGFPESNNVVDFVVRGDIVYVFSAGQLADGFKGYIHSSTDLANWTKEAEFILPSQAPPWAFELLDETSTFYIGLGTSAFAECSDPASGDIYKVLDTPVPPLPACQAQGGACLANSCSNYQNCSSLIGACPAGFCCSGVCTETPPVNYAPTITILGNNPLTYIPPDPFVDPGATAYDQEDGNLTAQIVVGGASIDLYTPPGAYYIIYSVADSGGLSAQAVREVNIPNLSPGAFEVDVSFEIEDEEGEPIESAWVMAYDQTGLNLIEDCFTGADGACQMSLVENRTFKLVVVEPDFERFDSSFTSGANLFIPIVLQSVSGGSGVSGVPGSPTQKELCCADSDCDSGLVCKCASEDCVKTGDAITAGRGGVCVQSGELVFCGLSLSEIVNNLADWIFWPAMGGGFLAVLIGGFVLASAGGSFGRIALGKKIMKWAVIILAGVLSLKIIFSLIKYLF